MFRRTAALAVGFALTSLPPAYAQSSARDTAFNLLTRYDYPEAMIQAENCQLSTRYTLKSAALEAIGTIDGVDITTAEMMLDQALEEAHERRNLLPSECDPDRARSAFDRFQRSLGNLRQAASQ